MDALWKHLCDSGNISQKKKEVWAEIEEEKLLDLQEESTEKAEITSKCINARNC